MMMILPAASPEHGQPEHGISIFSLLLFRENNKACSKDESERIKQVLQHPEFQKDPLAAITSHLSASLPPPPLEVPIKDNKQRKFEKKRRARLAKIGGEGNAGDRI